MRIDRQFTHSSCHAGGNNVRKELQALRDIACVQPMQTRIAELGGASVLVRLLNSKDGYISEAAAETLAAMSCGQPSIKVAIAELDPLPRLLNLASSYTQRHKVRRYGNSASILDREGAAAAKVLCNLADIGAVKLQLLEAEAIPILLEIVKGVDNPVQARKCAVATIAKMADAPGALTELLNNGAADALFSVVRETKDGVYRDSSDRRALQRAINGNLCKYVAGALAIIFAGAQGVQVDARVVDSWDMRYWIDLLESGDLAIQRNAVLALSELAYGQKFAEEPLSIFVLQLLR